MLNVGVLLAALGITSLEMAEASAVGIALYGESGNRSAFVAVSLGALLIFAIAGTVGGLISRLSIFYVRIGSATLLLYFGLRLVRSSRRSIKFQRSGSTGSKKEHNHEKGTLSTGFSVGAVEAFEAAIVLVALFPESYYSTLTGLFIGVAVVIMAAYVLKAQVRKIKQVIMKVIVSALLLTFSTFWYTESLVSLNDVFLAPIFVVFAVAVYYAASYGLGSPDHTSAVSRE